MRFHPVAEERQLLILLRRGALVVIQAAAVRRGRDVLDFVIEGGLALAPGPVEDAADEEAVRVSVIRSG